MVNYTSTDTVCFFGFRQFFVSFSRNKSYRGEIFSFETVDLCSFNFRIDSNAGGLIRNTLYTGFVKQITTATVTTATTEYAC